MLQRLKLCLAVLINSTCVPAAAGFWMDNDVLLLRDLHPLLAVSYQFIMRWTNAHCMLMFKGSLLLRKLMELARQLPLNHPKFKEDVIEKICKPVGYFAVGCRRVMYTRLERWVIDSSSRDVQSTTLFTASTCLAVDTQGGQQTTCAHMNHLWCLLCISM
jgi:hypothetical protein